MISTFEMTTENCQVNDFGGVSHRSALLTQPPWPVACQLCFSVCGIASLVFV